MSQVKDTNDTYLYEIITNIWNRYRNIQSLREYGNGTEYVDKDDITTKSKDINSNNIILLFRIYIFFTSFFSAFIITYIIHYAIIREKYPEDIKITMYIFGGFCIWSIISMIFFHSRLEK